MLMSSWKCPDDSGGRVQLALRSAVLLVHYHAQLREVTEACQNLQAVKSTQACFDA
jgi:hypothetical protein